MRYVLGIPDTNYSNKTEKGTIVHKALEGLALGKQAIQNDLLDFKDDVLGDVDCRNLYGEDFLTKMVRISYDHYVTKSTFKYTPKDFKDCVEWATHAVEFRNGSFDPRNLDIIEPELRFDFTIDEPWAEYDFITPDGNRIVGNLALKGTIDIVDRISPDVIESVDWKTGQRRCWNSGGIKTYEKLCVDPQLRLYHYALSKLFPDVSHFIPTIFHLRTEKAIPFNRGPRTMSYNDEDIKETEKFLRKRFEVIKACTRPRLSKSWKCTTICGYGREKHPSGKIDPKTGSPYTICQYIADKNAKCGMDVVVLEDTYPGHEVGFYQNPGE